MSRYAGWGSDLLKQQLAASVKAVKKNKYGAKRVQVDNIWFDSKAEAKRYSELKLMQSGSVISGLTIHPTYKIPGSVFEDQFGHICIVELDFEYWQNKEGRYIYEDVKGKDNPLSQLKRKLVETFYGIKVEIIK